MGIEERVAQRYMLAGWKPWTDSITRQEGFIVNLQADGDRIGYATLKQTDGTWYCAIYIGGGGPTVVGDGTAPARAAADARQKLEKALAVVR